MYCSSSCAYLKVQLTFLVFLSPTPGSVAESLKQGFGKDIPVQPTEAFKERIAVSLSYVN